MGILKISISTVFSYGGSNINCYVDVPHGTGLTTGEYFSWKC